MFKDLITNNKPLHWLSILFAVYVLFFNYSYFFIAGLILCILQSTQYSYTQRQINVLIKIPYVFFLMRLISGMTENLNYLWKSMSHPHYSLGARFFDLQQVLVSIKCNFGDVELFYFNFSKYTKSCPWSANYGPLLEIIPYFGTIWRDTIIISITLLCFILFFYKDLLDKFPKEKIYIVVLFLSPSMNFLFERMNIDIIVLLVSYYAIKKCNKYQFISSFLLISLALLKLHPLGFTLGIILYSYIYKKNKLLKINLVLLAFFSTVYIIFSYIKETALTTTWRPDDPLLAFGILSDAKYIEKNFEINLTSAYLLLLMSLFIFLFLHIRYLQIVNLESLNSNQIIFYSYGVFFLLNIVYANFDYRIPILFPLVIYLLPALSKNIKNFLLLPFLLLPFSLPGLEGVSQLIGAFFGKLCLYVFLLIILGLIYNDIKKIRLTSR